MNTGLFYAIFCSERIFTKMTPCRRRRLEKLIVTQLVKKSSLLWNTMVHYRFHNSPPGP